MTTLFQPLRVLARHGDPLLAAGIKAALTTTPGIEVVTASDPSSFPDAEVVICDYDSGMAWAHHQRLRASAMRQVAGVVVITWRDSEADVRTAATSSLKAQLPSR
jgi:DNA-binding NarL/FixJ family response regulator